MIAPLRQLQPIDVAEATLNGDAIADPAGARRNALLAAALGFFCCMPYVGIPIGNHAALQIGTLITIAIIIPALFTTKWADPLWMLPLLLGPLLLAMVNVGFGADGDMELAGKTFVNWITALATITAAQLCARQYSLEILTGIAVATIIHVLVGAYQSYCFSSGEFPFVWMYVNQSFLSVQDNAEIIAKYTQRPFGLFPEPSAMSSSLAPWVLFWIAEMCGIVKMRRKPAVWQRALFAVSAAAALGLIIVSRSGHAAVTLAAALVFVGIWFIRCRATPNSYLAVLGVFGVAMPIVLYFAAEALSDRMGMKKSDLGNTSWEDRSNSILIGFNLFVDRDLRTLVFGNGPGQTSPVLQRIWRLEAVWSVLLTYIYETGIAGILVVCWIARYLLRMAKSSGWNVAYIAITGVWLVGITLTTSYFQLLMLWVTLGWLTVWPSICLSAEEMAQEESGDSSAQATGTLLGESRTSRSTPHTSRWVPQGWREPQLPLTAADPAEIPEASETKLPKRWSEWN